MNKILILKNDRTGDLFTSIPTINLIFNKHISDDIELFLSKINHKFSFLFKDKKIKIINIDLNFFDKINILFYFLFNKIDSVYILSPKNFYYYLPFIFFFKKIKFYGICIDSIKKRPSNFLRKFLYKKIILDRINIRKRKSTYIAQTKLIEPLDQKLILINKDAESDLKVDIPHNSIFFHYKHKMFAGLLKWDFLKVKKFIENLSRMKGNIIFSSEIGNSFSDNFFSENFNTYDFASNKLNKINEKQILFLKNIDGLDLYTAIKKSSEIIAPEGIITHIGFSFNKKILSLMHFELKNRQDFINQVISCKEWFPPNNFNFIVLKKNFEISINKLNKRI